MIVDKFNRSLQRYSHNLTALRMLRAEISACSTQVILTYLARTDPQEKGYFTVQQLQLIWLGDSTQNGQNLGRFMGKLFPFQKISYTIIHHFLISSDKSPTNNATNSQNIDVLAKKIFTLQLQTSEIEAIIVDKLEYFVPMKYSRPTEEELSKYVICQHLTVDIRQVSKSLNLLQSNSDLRNKRPQVDYQKTLANPSVNNLQDIMKRLQSRVNSFGGEKLVPKQFQK